MAFLCGTQGYAVKLNNKGQKMVKRIIALPVGDFSKAGSYSDGYQMNFTYNKDNSLRTVNITTNGASTWETIINNTNNEISISRRINGKKYPDHRYIVTLDKNGNISTLDSGCIGLDGSILSDMVKYEYFYDEELGEYRIGSVTSWTQDTDKNGKTSSANGDNEHGKAYWYYVDGNIYADTKYYANNREYHIGSPKYGEYIYDEFLVDDTNVNMSEIVYRKGKDQPSNLLPCTEWLPYKTHNLVTGIYGGEKNPILRSYQYGYDDDGNIVSVYENNIHWGRWRSSGFVERYRIEYVD
ncbi:MAG: hypothetical protein LUD72_12495 [Bacteroidales bacterium]|nr:hypothetical protein [Bacteroidales bacterium]